MFPLQLLLKRACRDLEEIEEAEQERTGSLPAHRKLRRQIARKMQSAKQLLVTRPVHWLSRRPCLQPLRVCLVQGRRKLLVWGLVLLIRLLRSFLGTPRR